MRFVSVSYLSGAAILLSAWCLPSAFAQQFTISTIAGASPSLAPVSALSASLGQPQRVTFDGSGNLIFSAGNAVYKLDASGNVTLLAGSKKAGYSGDGGAATAASLNGPQGVAVDTSSGNLYISDTNNHVIRMVTPAGTITTYAGNGIHGYSGDGSPAIAGQFYAPTALAFYNGTLYIVDTQNNAIRTVSSDGTLGTFSGNGYHGSGGDGAAASGGQLSGPQDIAIDSSGNIFIADTGNAKIREVTASTGYISTYAGGGSTDPGDGGAATSAVLDTPNGVAVDSSGNVYISQTVSGSIRQVNSKAVINVFAGTGTPGFSGDGSTATKAQLWNPLGMVTDSSGNLYVADQSNLRIRKIASGNISTVAGNGLSNFGGDGGPAVNAQIDTPIGVAADNTGNVYFADSANHRVRKISLDGTISTLAGNGSTGSGGDGGQATSAQLTQPAGVAVDASGNVYIADLQNNVIRKVGPDGSISTYAGTGTGGFSGDGGPASKATLYSPYALAVDAAGNLYFSDYTTCHIRRIGLDGNIATIAGTGINDYTGDGGPAVQAAVNRPQGLAVDANGNIYIADTGNNVIREITTDGNINTVAGIGLAGHDGDGGKALDALLAAPTGVAVDTKGNIYIADSGTRIRVVTTDGMINTIAGTGIPGYSGDGGAATNAQLSSPSGIALDQFGDLFITDTANNAIRRLTPPAKSTTNDILPRHRR